MIAGPGTDSVAHVGAQEQIPSDNTLHRRTAPTRKACLGLVIVCPLAAREGYGTIGTPVKLKDK